MTRMTTDSADITTLLSAWSRGHRAAFDRVVPLVYAELRKIAARQLRRDRLQEAIQPTDLVHTLFLQLVDQRHAAWTNREAFYAIAARMMRRILVDHARARHAAKRGGRAPFIPLDEMTEVGLLRSAETAVTDVLAVDQLLSRLEARDPLQARIVELRFFLGLSTEDTAAVIGKAPRTVKREWRQARAWLFRELTGDASGHRHRG
jgi:RNA polymerase sigma factor (TIGR02999 family)